MTQKNVSQFRNSNPILKFSDKERIEITELIEQLILDRRIGQTNEYMANCCETGMTCLDYIVQVLFIVLDTESGPHKMNHSNVYGVIRTI